MHSEAALKEIYLPERITHLGEVRRASPIESFRSDDYQCQNRILYLQFGIWATQVAALDNIRISPDHLV